MKLFGLITTFFLTVLTVSAAPTQANTPLPTHFGLFMYSLDGGIVNQTLYARSQPCVDNVTAPISTVMADEKYGTFGSYTWGLGPHNHLFSYKDGRIATCAPSCTVSRQVFGGTSQVMAQTWEAYYKRAMLPEIPICGIARNTCTGTFSLKCKSQHQELTWSFCGSTSNSYGQMYTLDVLSWSTVVAPGCKEVDVRVVDVVKNWGNQTFSHTGIYENCTTFLESMH